MDRGFSFRSDCTDPYKDDPIRLFFSILGHITFQDFSLALFLLKETLNKFYDFVFFFLFLFLGHYISFWNAFFFFFFFEENVITPFRG
jgi:hypothetical protein